MKGQAVAAEMRELCTRHEPSAGSVALTEELVSATPTEPAHDGEFPRQLMPLALLDKVDLGPVPLRLIERARIKGSRRCRVASALALDGLRDGTGIVRSGNLLR